MQPRCREGDLAVVINAFHRCNVGRIVKVLSLHDGKGDLVFKDSCVVWLVESAQPMTWRINKKRYRRKKGPVPDELLKPIRGNSCYDEHDARLSHHELHSGITVPVEFPY